MMTVMQSAQMRLPLKIWIPGKLPQEDDPQWVPVFEQFKNLTNHPLASKWVCGMPDYHLGYGMPIGGVLATKGGVVPNAVGVDIGCGMVAVRTTLEATSFSKGDLEELRNLIHAQVPVGKGSHTTLGSPAPKVPEGAGPVTVGEYDRAQYQLGTLGGGNHFIEIQRDEEGYLWIMLHSGSRHIGLSVCNYYHKIAKKYMEAFHVDVHPDLSFLPNAVPEAADYLGEMHWCMKWAEENRQTMLNEVFRAFETIGRSLEDRITLEVDTHHNFATLEYHFGESLLIHRKGAVKADGLVTLPGSMGTSSYICRGLNPKDSFNTCAHGAGRQMGRKVANATITHEEAVKAMENVVYGVRQGDYDEMPRAYKDIEEVMGAQSDLAEPVYRLTPLMVVKG